MCHGLTKKRKLKKSGSLSSIPTFKRLKKGLNEAAKMKSQVGIFLFFVFIV